MAVYSEILDTEKKYIEASYSLNILKISKIKNGILNSNFLIETQNKKYILRIFEADRTLEEEEQELKFLNQIYKFIPISKPIMSKNNKYILEINNKKFSLFDYVDGEILKETNENYLEQIGEYLGKIHKFSENIKKEEFNRKSRIDFDFYYNEIKKRGRLRPYGTAALSGGAVAPYPKLKKKQFVFRASAMPRVAKREQPLRAWRAKNDLEKIILCADEIKKINFSNLNLPSGIIHSDIFQDNILVKNKKIKAILDFNEAHHSAFIYDIATVISFWIKNKNFDKEKENKFIKIFLNSYSKYRKITDKEKEFLDLACKKVILLFILLRFYKENIEKIYSQNFDIEEKSYKDLLRLIK